MITRRSASALLAAFVALTALAAPVAAVSVARVVDADGHATATNCDAAPAVLRHIQAAVVASHPGDRILVCPGVYQEQLKIGTNGLTIRATTENAAQIRTPAVLAGPNLIDIQATGVTIRGFKLKALAGASGCQEVESMVYVAPGASADITHDRIGTLGTLTQGPCGYQFGIFTESGGTVGTEATSTITFDRIRNFKRNGVMVNRPGAMAVIADNVFRWRHLQPAGAFCSLPVTRGGTRGGLVSTGAVSFRSGSGGTVTRNDISSLSTHPCQTLGSGVGVDESNFRAAAETLGPPSPHGAVFVSNDVIEGARIGLIFGGHQKIRSADDSVTGAAYGAWLFGATDVVLRRFTGTHGVAGILVDSNSTGNKIRDGDVRGNSGKDCEDDSTGVSSGGTGNKWLSVKGNDANRAGICTPGVVTP